LDNNNSNNNKVSTNNNINDTTSTNNNDTDNNLNSCTSYSRNDKIDDTTSANKNETDNNSNNLSTNNNHNSKSRTGQKELISSRTKSDRRNFSKYPSRPQTHDYFWLFLHISDSSQKSTLFTFSFFRVQSGFINLLGTYFWDKD